MDTETGPATDGPGGGASVDGPGGAETGAATEGPPALPAPRPNGLFAGPAEAPDRFELLGEGRRGGEGITWRASYRGELRSAVPLAVKVLHRPEGTGADWPSPETLQRWQDRTVLLQHLHLERVVWLNEVFVGAPPHRRDEPGDDIPVPYLVMEWIDGPALADLLGGEPATAATIGQRMQYVREVAEALHELHVASRASGNPSLHRDVKPGNCIVNPARGVVLIDVGGMRTLDDGFDPAGMHTAAYTAPEILRNPYRPREAAGDRYALGALAVFCLLGEDPPAAGAALPDLVAPRIRAVARTAGVADPDALVAHVLAMLRSDPASRPDSGPAWATQLQPLALSATISGTRHHTRPSGDSSSGAPHDDGISMTPNSAAGSGAPKSWRRWPVLAAALALGAIGGGIALAAPWRPASTSTAGAGTDGPTPLPSVTVATPAGTSLPSPGGLTPSGGAIAATTDITAASGVTTGPVPVPTEGSVTTKATVTRTTTAAATTAAATTSSGKISSPSAGSDVLNCAYLSGTATLAAGKTLILAARNLDNDEPDVWYAQYTFGWTDPSTLSSWRGAEYFPGDIGQQYEVGLFAVDLGDAQAARNSDAALRRLADTGAELANRRFVRVSGNTGNDCPGPA
ncbi:serine/threonine protein kinase [Actinoplanes sp. HUAS TT8]|uniref:serine/threonine protein kinase n=1 Tax=Actinoplanes sp. HUAS TT8 TaxID=3447453 RepID=UPI003F51C0B1